MKTLKYITTAFQFLKNLIMKSTKTENNKANLTVIRGKFKFTKNAALSRMYSQDSEMLFI